MDRYNRNESDKLPFKVSDAKKNARASTYLLLHLSIWDTLCCRDFFLHVISSSTWYVGSSVCSTTCLIDMGTFIGHFYF